MAKTSRQAIILLAIKRVLASFAVLLFVFSSAMSAVAADYPGQGTAGPPGGPASANGDASSNPTSPAGTTGITAPTPAPPEVTPAGCLTDINGCSVATTSPGDTPSTPAPTGSGSPYDPKNQNTKVVDAQLVELSGVLNGTFLGTGFPKWMQTAQTEALKLFRLLFPLEIIVTGMVLLFRARDNSEVVTTMTMKFLAASAFIYMINNAPTIFNAIPNYFVSEAQTITAPDATGQMGSYQAATSGCYSIPANGATSPCDPLSPGFLVKEGFVLSGQIMQRASRAFFSQNAASDTTPKTQTGPGDVGGAMKDAAMTGLNFFGHAMFGAILVMPLVILSQIVIIGAYLAMAGMLAVTEMEAQILGTVGALVLGFSAFRYTSSYSEKFISLAFSVGAKLFIMFIMAAVGARMMSEATTRILPTLDGVNALSLLMLPVVAAFMLILFWKVPQLASSFTSGSVGMNLGQIVQSAAAVAGAAVTAAAAGPAALGLAAKAKEGAMKAMQGANSLQQAVGGASKALGPGSSESTGSGKTDGGGAQPASPTKTADGAKSPTSAPPISVASDIAQEATTGQGGEKPPAPGKTDEMSPFQPPESKNNFGEQSKKVKDKGKGKGKNTAPPTPPSFASQVEAGLADITAPLSDKMDGSGSPSRESLDYNSKPGDGAADTNAGDSAPLVGVPGVPGDSTGIPDGADGDAAATQPPSNITSGGKKGGKGSTKKTGAPNKVLVGVGGGGASGGDGGGDGPPAGGSDGPPEGTGPGGPPQSSGGGGDQGGQQTLEGMSNKQDQQIDLASQSLAAQKQSTKAIEGLSEAIKESGGGSLASRMGKTDDRQFASMIGEAVAGQLKPKGRQSKHDLSLGSGRLFDLADRMKGAGRESISEIQAVAMASSVAGQSGHAGGHDTGARI